MYVFDLDTCLLTYYFNRYHANVPEKKLKKGAKRIVMGYVADLCSSYKMKSIQEGI